MENLTNFEIVLLIIIAIYLIIYIVSLIIPDEKDEKITKLELFIENQADTIDDLLASNKNLSLHNNMQVTILNKLKGQVRVYENKEKQEQGS